MKPEKEQTSKAKELEKLRVHLLKRILQNEAQRREKKVIAVAR